MSSKETINLTPAMIANIRATMCNIESLTVNWAGVRGAIGVSSNGNAAQGFRNAMKAFGLKVVDTKNWTFGDENDEAPAADTDPSATLVKKRGRPKKTDSPEAKRKKTVTPKKDMMEDKDEVKLEDGAGKEDVEATQE